MNLFPFFVSCTLINIDRRSITFLVWKPHCCATNHTKADLLINVSGYVIIYYSVTTIYTYVYFLDFKIKIPGYFINFGHSLEH